MTDPLIHSESPPPAKLLICGFGPFPGFPENPAAQVVENLRARDWTSEGVETGYLLLPTTWGGAVETIAATLRANPAEGVLVLGVAGGAETFRVETWAHNRAAVDKPDAAGIIHPRVRISDLGPATAPVTGPIEPLVAALAHEDLPACASRDAGDYLCNYVLYRLVTEFADGPDSLCVAFLHLPPTLSLADLERGVEAAASALGRSLVLDTPHKVAATI